MAKFKLIYKFISKSKRDKINNQNKHYNISKIKHIKRIEFKHIKNQPNTPDNVFLNIEISDYYYLVKCFTHLTAHLY